MSQEQSVISESTNLASKNTPKRTVPLTQLQRGQSGRVQIDSVANDEIKMLRAMGLRPDASITMCRHGEPCIVSLSGVCGGGCRIGLAKEIAGRVLVSIDQ